MNPNGIYSVKSDRRVLRASLDDLFLIEERRGMISDPRSVVGRALNRQVEIFGGLQISLDSLWREAGCPDDRDPRTWARLAEPLLRGYADYIAAVHPLDPKSVGESIRPLLWTWNGDSKDPWRSGDLMTISTVAWVYAAFLEFESKEDRSGLD